MTKDFEASSPEVRPFPEGLEGGCKFYVRCMLDPDCDYHAMCLVAVERDPEKAMFTRQPDGTYRRKDL